MNEDRVNINMSAVVRLIVLLAIFIFALSGWFWWRDVYESPSNVFWGMIGNNLSTTSVTRHLVQTAADKSIDQYIREQFGAINAAESTVTLKQIGPSGQTIVKSDTIGTPQNDYSRYISITTPQKTSKGQPINTTGVINVWGKSPDAKKGQASTAQYFQQSVITIIPYGNFNNDQKQVLINRMRNQTIYDFSGTPVKTSKQDGRAVYVYEVKINPSAYVELMQQYAKDVGLGDLGLDPSAYANSPPLNAEITVDKLSRQLVKINYPSTNQSETIADQGLDQPIALPTNTIPIADLQNRIQKIVQ